MKQILYALFGYRFIYVGMSTRNLGRLKIGIARNVKLRWKSIDQSMRGKQFPIFCLPCFHAIWFEGHLHRVMKPFNKPVQGDGGSEFFTYMSPFSWPGWIYVFLAITWAFLASHLLIYFAISWVWCWYNRVDFMGFQNEVWRMVLGWITALA